jgi:hypothetical protein
MTLQGLNLGQSNWNYAWFTHAYVLVPERNLHASGNCECLRASTCASQLLRSTSDVKSNSKKSEGSTPQCTHITTIFLQISNPAMF